MTWRAVDPTLVPEERLVANPGGFANAVYTSAEPFKTDETILRTHMSTHWNLLGGDDAGPVLCAVGFGVCLGSQL